MAQVAATRSSDGYRSLHWDARRRSSVGSRADGIARSRIITSESHYTITVRHICIRKGDEIFNRVEYFDGFAAVLEEIDQFEFLEEELNCPKEKQPPIASVHVYTHARTDITSIVARILVYQNTGIIRTPEVPEIRVRSIAF